MSRTGPIAMLVGRTTGEATGARLWRIDRLAWALLLCGLLVPGAASAAVSFVDVRTASGVDVTRLTLPRPASVPGDVLVVGLHASDDRTTTRVAAPFLPGGGWAPIWNCPRATGTNQPPYPCPYANGQLILYAKAVTASEPTSYTFSFTSDGITPQRGLHSGFIAAYRHVYTAALASGSGMSGTTTRSTTCPARPERAAAVLLCAVAVRGAASVPAPPAGMTLRTNLTPRRATPVVGRSLFMADRAGVTAGAKSFGWQSSTAEANAVSAGISLTIPPAPPLITPSGKLFDVRSQVVFPGSYPITVRATDGIPGEAGPGIDRVQLHLDGHVIDVAQQTCTGACDLSHTFWLNTSSLEAGSHSIYVSAVDREGTSGGTAWSFTADPRRTVFGLATSATVDEVVAAAANAGVEWIELRHTGHGQGGYFLGHESPNQAVADYKDDIADEYGTDVVPAVSGFTVGGDVAAAALGTLGARVATRQVATRTYGEGDIGDELLAEDGLYYDDALLAADIAAEEQSRDTREAQAAGARSAAAADAKPFAPSYGQVNTYNWDVGRPRRIAQTLTFPMEAVGDVDGDGDKKESPFERDNALDHGYEHDFKLIDPD